MHSIQAPVMLSQSQSVADINKMNRSSSSTLSKLHRYQAVHQGKRSGLLPTDEVGGHKELAGHEAQSRTAKKIENKIQKEDTALETLMKNLKNEQE